MAAYIGDLQMGIRFTGGKIQRVGVAGIAQRYAERRGAAAADNWWEAGGATGGRRGGA